ncbi:putative potassium transporter [Aureobasidium pullulans]|uniref:Potassium transporter n=1 Tax=Aureobasidium pullulans TaxID=5580 RepID=A0A4S9Q4E0_AURPU|nr:putative potassium transporter [Aureobasidium pullulans]THZ44740.1 putative potassium transporter [Aureobasidium pullulans]THZ59764.1 putative potassium transporter [Aureobasidium pullulans]
MSENGHVHFDDKTLQRERTKESSMSSRKKSIAEKEADIESVWSDEPYGLEERDYKKKQSTGVIYGDIGTSPLYVYSSTFSSEPSRDDLLGALSLIIWSLTLIVTIKYVLIVLAADDEGEGGTFAICKLQLFSLCTVQLLTPIPDTLLSRFSDIMKRDPRTYHAIKMERYPNAELNRQSRSIRAWLEKSKVAHAILKILAVFGVSLIIADGILTPAQSVLGAIQGLKVVDDSIGSPTIIGVSCAILVLLFVLQPLGIQKLASCFAPIVILWLLFNMSFGIYNLVMHDWKVLKAFSPYYAGLYFMRLKEEGWQSLGGILLCFTGVEALFADLGAFSKRAVQISWLCLTFPCLLLAYIGQAAYISRTPSAYANPFFETVPPGMFYPSLVLSILAAIVASQALITSTFQLLIQLMHSSYFPQIKATYTSTKFHGQVYIPLANWIMMVGTVIVTAVYSNTTKLGHAYGVCVILVTFITTNLVTLVALIVWKTNPFLVFAIWLPLVTLDGLYLSSALTKVPDGAWFTLLLAMLLASFFSLWRYGKEKQWTTEAKTQAQLSELVVYSSNNLASSTATSHDMSAKKSFHLSWRHGGGELTETKGMGIFFDKSGTDIHVPQVYEHFITKFEAQMQVVVFLHLRALSEPHVHEEDRYTIARTPLPNVYRMTIRYGYVDRVVTPDLGKLVYEQVRMAIVRGTVVSRPKATVPETVMSRALHTVGDGELDADTATVTTFAADGPEPSTSGATALVTSHRLLALDNAFKTQTLYLVGKQQLRVYEMTGWVKKTLLGAFLFVRENTRAKVAQLDVPVEKLVEVGFVGEI